MSKTWRIFLSAVIYLTFTASAVTAQGEEPLKVAPAGSTVANPAEPTSATVAASANLTVVPEITNLDSIAKALKLERFKGKTGTRTLNVAIFDNGFNSYQNVKSLPEGTRYRDEEPTLAKSENSSLHGTLFAKLTAELIKASGAQVNYKLHLFQTSGYTKLAYAVDKVIEEKFDIVLYAQVWENAENLEYGEGKGVINALVNKALNKGIVWVNAVGNYGRLLRTVPVDGKKQGGAEWAMWPLPREKSSESTTVTCEATGPFKKCPLSLTLAWNDFKETVDAGTDKDLDLYVYDSKNVLVAKSETKQKLTGDKSDTTSLAPFEMIEQEVEPGTYTVKVKVAGGQFSIVRDKMWLAASGVGITIGYPTTGENVLPPANNPGVIAAGALGDEYSSRSLKTKRPDVELFSELQLADKSRPSASSVTATLVFAESILEMGTATDLTGDPAKVRETLIARIKAASPVTAMAKAVVPNGGPRAGQLPTRSGSGPSGDNAGNGGGRQRVTRSNGGIPVLNTDDEPVEAPRAARAALVDRCGDPVRVPVIHDNLRWLIDIGGRVQMAPDGVLQVLIDSEVAEDYNLIPRDPYGTIFITAKGQRTLNPNQVLQKLPQDYYEVVAVEGLGCGRGRSQYSHRY